MVKLAPQFDLWERDKQGALESCAIRKSGREFLLGCSGKESDWYPGGCGFHPWPCSVGRGSSVAMSCGVGHRSCVAVAVV